MAYYPQRESDPVEMRNIFNSLCVLIKIFFDLNAQVRCHPSSSLFSMPFLVVYR